MNEALKTTPTTRDQDVNTLEDEKMLVRSMRNVSRTQWVTLAGEWMAKHGGFQCKQDECHMPEGTDGVRNHWLHEMTAVSFLAALSERLHCDSIAIIGVCVLLQRLTTHIPLNQ